MRYQTSLAVVVFVLLATQGQAHSDGGVVGGFTSGLLHPVFGWDHVVAMVAVGLWGSFLGNPATWLLPVVFPLVMAIGGALGILGLPFPEVETGIALSGVVLGLAVLLAIRAPLPIAAVVVGIFALFHGYAHGTELPSAANPFAYAIGFMLATGALHMAGIGLGLLNRIPNGSYVVRGLGGGVMVVGLGFLFGLF